MNSRQNQSGQIKSGRLVPLIVRVVGYFAIAVSVLAIFYGPRQITQRRAIAELKKINAQARTQPIALPFVANVFGPEYSEEVIEAYLVSPEHTDAQLETVIGLTSLQKLELSGSKITSDGLSKLSGLRNLYTLHLTNTLVDDSGLTSVSSLKNLGILSLTNTKVTDAGIAKLASMDKLERLSLDGTAITDVGLGTISQMTSLKELTLTRTKVTDVGADLLKSLKKLEILKIHETEVSIDKMKELSEALPDCAVLLSNAT